MEIAEDVTTARFAKRRAVELTPKDVVGCVLSPSNADLGLVRIDLNGAGLSLEVSITWKTTGLLVHARTYSDADAAIVLFDLYL